MLAGAPVLPLAIARGATLGMAAGVSLRRDDGPHVVKGHDLAASALTFVALRPAVSQQA